MNINRIRAIVLESETNEGRAFDLLMQFLIILSTVIFSLETLPDLSTSTYSLLEGIELIIVSLFFVEYILRIILNKNRISYMFSFYGIIDFLSILPLFLIFFSGTQTLRVLKLLRLVRALKLTKYSLAMRRIGKAIAIAKEELILFSFVTMLLLYLSALGIYYFEHEVQPNSFRSIFDCLWWAVATLTTVGYGDVYPITVGGRIFTFAVLMLGLGVVAVPTGIISSALAEARKNV